MRTRISNPSAKALGGVDRVERSKWVDDGMRGDLVPSRVGIADWVGPRDGDPPLIIYLSGRARGAGFGERELWERTGYPYRCLSFAYLNTERKAEANRDDLETAYVLDNPAVRIFLDSGAHTFQNLYYSRRKKLEVGGQATARDDVLRAVDAYITRYSKFLQTWRPACQVDFYVTFDYIHNCKVIYEMTERLFALGIRPVPVYHGDDDIDWLRRYVDAGHRFIGISFCQKVLSMVRRVPYYDKVFDFGAKHGVRFHGFALTGPEIIRFPWWSVDSTSWLKQAFYGIISNVHETPRGIRIAYAHVSERTSRIRGLNSLPVAQYASLRDQVEARGFDLEELRRSRPQRALYNTLTYKIIMERFAKRTRTRQQRSLF